MRHFFTTCFWSRYETIQWTVCSTNESSHKRSTPLFKKKWDFAVKYGKQARVAIRSKSQNIEITVDDDRPGIPDDELVRVFQPFYCVEVSRNRETGGIGLGLAIAISVMQVHGGQLTLSNRPGGGLRASVELPARLSWQAVQRGAWGRLM